MAYTKNLVWIRTNMDKPVIQINHLEGISWNKQISDFKIDHATDVWRIRVSSHLQDIGDLWLLLHPAEQQRANGYRREQDKRRFMMSYGFLRILLGRYLAIAPKDIIFEAGHNGKPRMKTVENKALYFNISHSGDYVLIAIGDQETGVDVEKTDKKVHLEEIMNIGFSKVEIAFVETSDNPADSFYRLWTRKEALLKATSLGIDDYLKLVPSINGSYTDVHQIITLQTNWTVTSFDVDQDYVGAVAYHNARVNFKEVIAL